MGIRGPLRGHNDTPFGRPTLSWPIDRPGFGHPQGVFGVFSDYQLVMLFLNNVCLTVALTFTNNSQTELSRQSYAESHTIV
jgi:hypothetical protein